MKKIFSIMFFCIIMNYNSVNSYYTQESCSQIYNTYISIKKEFWIPSNLDSQLRDISNKKEISNCFLKVWNAYLYKKDYNKAIENYKYILNLNVSIDFIFLINIWESYYNLSEYEYSLYYYNLAHERAVEKEEINIINNILPKVKELYNNELKIKQLQNDRILNFQMKYKKIYEKNLNKILINISREKSLEIEKKIIQIIKPIETKKVIWLKDEKLLWKLKALEEIFHIKGLPIFDWSN